VNHRGVIDKGEGRRLFGSDPAAYDAARPGHAERVYEILVTRCGLRPGAKVLEIGPGTGQATNRLLELGADPLVAIEPDPELAGFLRDRFGDRVELRRATLEAAELEDDFDLAAAASSFHWVDEEVGLERIHGALRPGGWVALWWTVFGDATREDPFRDAVDPLMKELPRSPSQSEQGRPPFASDGGARVAALAAAGFAEITPHRLEWSHTWDTEGIRGLFGSFSPILALEPGRREALLDAVAHMADTDFGAQVTKPLVTALYTARKPA
jgi:SAM-dependent methyltransferase